MIKTLHGNSEKFIGKIKNKKFLFILVIGGTQTIQHPGISAAGASHEMLPYTAALDAEFIEYGEVKSLNSLPVSPAKVVSPAVISKACLGLSNSKHLIVDTGVPVSPQINFETYASAVNMKNCRNIRLSGSPSKSVETGHVLSKEVVDNLYKKGQKVIEAIIANHNDFDYFVIGECVVGGTTTALGLLHALGHDCMGMVSSSIPSGNHALKEELIAQGYKNALTRNDFSMKLVKESPLLAVSAMGDPMQAVVAGMTKKATNNCKPVLLAGGSQMVAIASLVEKLIAKDISDFCAIATTPWIVNDQSAQTKKLIKNTCKHTSLIYPNIDTSNHKILKSYDKGHVKEGVGAGGLITASHLSHNLKASDIFSEIDKLNI